MSEQTLNSQKPAACPCRLDRLVMPFSRDRIGDILQALYDSEINISISWLWDGGIDVCVDGGWGGPDTWKAKATIMNCHDGPDRHDAFAEAVNWIANKAIELCPDSTFAKRCGSGEFKCHSLQQANS